MPVVGVPEEHSRILLNCAGRLLIFHQRQFRDGKTESTLALARRGMECVANYLLHNVSPEQVIDLHSWLGELGGVDNKVSDFRFYDHLVKFILETPVDVPKNQKRLLERFLNVCIHDYEVGFDRMSKYLFDGQMENTFTDKRLMWACIKASRIMGLVCYGVTLAASEHEATAGYPEAHEGMLANGVAMATISNKMFDLNKKIVNLIRKENGGDESFGYQLSYGLVRPDGGAVDDYSYVANSFIYNGAWSTMWSDARAPKYMPKFGAGQVHGFGPAF